MSPPNSTREVLLRYAVALLAPLLALALRMLLAPILGEQAPLILFILAGAAAAWWGGLWPGILAFSLGAVLAIWVFMSDQPHWGLGTLPERMRIVLYFFVGVLICIMAEALHRAIRHQREREPALRRSEERYRAFIATSHEAIWRIELDEPISTVLPVDEQIRLYFERAFYAEVNDALARLYGFTGAAQVVGLRVREVEPPTRSETIEALRKFITQGYRRTGEISHEQDRHGAPRNFLNNYVGLVEKGCLVRLWGSSLDITEHRRAEQALRESEGTLKGFHESSPIPMGIIELGETDLFMLYNNPATCRLFGTPPGATDGRWTSEFGVAPELLTVWMAPYRESARTNAPVSVETPFDIPGRARIWLALTVAPIPVGASGRPRFCYVMLDVTARRAFEQELMEARDRAEAASRTKDDLLAALSHELRTPLNPVLLAASVAMRDDTRSAEEREDWAMVHRNISLQSRLVDDLLDFTRATHGKVALRLQTVELPALLRDALDTVRPEAEARRQSLALECSAPDPRVPGDAGRLQQVFCNLLKNAIKFTPEAGVIQVEIRVGTRASVHAPQELPGDVLLVAIRDNGLGLTTEEQTRIFEAFVQGDHAKSRGHQRYGGLGLGLAISRELVHLHGGRIWAESDGRDQGATFFVALPVAGNAGAGSATSTDLGAPEDAAGMI
jgi:PAS domain S-box-containing protein